MISCSFFSWVQFCCIITLAIVAGISITRFIPWTETSRRVNMPFAFGISIAPILLGLSSACALIFFPGWSHRSHLLVTVLFLCFAILPNIKNSFLHISSLKNLNKKFNWQEGLLFLILFIWIAGLFLDVVFFPVTQNDALEYVTVGKILFEQRDLIVYPVLNPLENNAGFYGPWTHPPLYVSLIYLMNVIQGGADSPALLKFIAPLFALGATLLVYKIGLLTNRKTGLFAAIIFLSCPLYFLGAAETLIDPLPVLGMTIILVSVISSNGSLWGNGLFQGIVLGVALWTHSEAILFIPLIVVAIITFNGMKQLRISIYQIAICLFIALTLSFYPYFKNFQIYGSIISDNPLVFQIPELDWQSYFTVGRGVQSVCDKIRNGVFKGWFVIDAYSMIFWVMTIGIIFYVQDIWSRKIFPDILFGRKNLYAEQVDFAFLLMLLCYLAGVVLSITLNIDLMIRNERYQLILLPIVSLFGAKALYVMTQQCKNGFCRTASVFIYICFMIAIILQFFFIQNRTFSRFKLMPLSVSIPIEKKLENWDTYLAMKYLKDKTHETAIVLSMQPSEMFYAKRRMVSYLDPRMKEFYLEKDPVRGSQRLEQLGVLYIHVPNYTLPTLGNSILKDILKDPQLSELVFSSGGFQIFKLNKRPATKVCFLKDATPGKIAWTKTNSFIVGGRQVSFPIYSKKELFNGVNTHFFGKNKHNNIVFWSGNDDVNHQDIVVEGAKEYRVDFELVGHSFVTLFVKEINSKGEVIAMYKADEFILNTNKDVVQKFYKRIVTNRDTRYIQIGFKSGKNFVIRNLEINIIVTHRSEE